MTQIPKWTFEARSSRAAGKVRGTLRLDVDAATQEEAETLVRASLPGFDWEQWVSAWGVVSPLTGRRVKTNA